MSLTPNRNNLCFTSEQVICRDIEEVFAFFSDAKNLERLTPPWLSFRIVNVSSPTVEKDTVIEYKLKIHRVPVRWKTLILEWQPQKRFVDFQLSGPYSLWHHTHVFEKCAEGTLMKDEIIYRIPFGILGRLLLGEFIRRDIETIFDYRRKVIKEFFS